MIFNFRIVSDEVDHYRREIKIDANATFLDLKDAICKANEWNPDEMSSFFLCDDRWEKEKEITMEDMGHDTAREIYLMDESVLADFIEDEGQRLLFTFDYMTDRSLFLEMKELITGQDLHEPLCTLSRDKAPAQSIDLDEFEAKMAARAAASAASEDMDESFYGSDTYNEDELDLEGFDEMQIDQDN